MAKYDQPPNMSSRLTGNFEVTPDESEVETNARLERSRSYQQLQHWRERLTVTSVVVGLAMLFVFSLVTISLPGSTPEAKEVARQGATGAHYRASRLLRGAQGWVLARPHFAKLGHGTRLAHC